MSGRKATERYSRYEKMVLDPDVFDPSRCDAVVSVKDGSVSGWTHSQCKRRPVKDGLCKQHSRMDEVPFMKWNGA